MTTKHTAGPWNISERFVGKPYVNIVCEQTERGETVIAEQIGIQANARLIAAAPELLAACKAAEVSLIGDEHYSEFRDVVATLRAAIARAEGGAA